VVGERVELSPRLVEGVELFEQLRRHVVDDLRRLVLDDPDLDRVGELGNREVRPLAAVEDVVVRLDRLEAAGDLGPELAGLGGQPDKHGNPLVTVSATLTGAFATGTTTSASSSWVSSMSWKIQSWQASR